MQTIVPKQLKQEGIQSQKVFSSTYRQFTKKTTNREAPNSRSGSGSTSGPGSIKDKKVYFKDKQLDLDIDQHIYYKTYFKIKQKKLNKVIINRNQTNILSNKL